MKDKLDFSKLVPHCHTVVQYAVILAFYMGFKKIYLMGCECTGILKTIETVANTPMANYYAYKVENEDKERFSMDIKSEFYGHYALLHDYEIHHQYLAARGVKLVNLTEGGILKNIPCSTLDKVLNNKDKNND